MDKRCFNPEKGRLRPLLRLISLLDHLVNNLRFGDVYLWFRIRLDALFSKPGVLWELAHLYLIRPFPRLTLAFWTGYFRTGRSLFFQGPCRDSLYFGFPVPALLKSAQRPRFLTLTTFFPKFLRSSLGRCNDGEDAGGNDVPSWADAAWYPLEEAFWILLHQAHSLIEDIRLYLTKLTGSAASYRLRRAHTYRWWPTLRCIQSGRYYFDLRLLLHITIILFIFFYS